MAQTTTAYIGLGSNLGDRADTIRRALALLAEHPAVHVMRVSELIETEPTGGPANQGMFLNGAAELHCQLDAGRLLTLLLDVENQLGRRRHGKWGPRTIDLDLLLFGREIIDQPDLCVPHPLMHQREFVLRPLAQIAGHVVHPRLRQTIAELNDALSSDTARDIPPSYHTARPTSSVQPGVRLPSTSGPITGLIAVSGIIGVGKTTLARQLAQQLDAELVCEEYDANPFLPRQLSGDHRAALPSELFFLLSRARQLDREQIDVSRQVVADYVFDKNRLFARMNLTDAEMPIYDNLERTVCSYIAQPSLVLYLHDSVENCLSRIEARARYYEQRISAPWLEQLSDAYERLLESWTTCPVHRVDCGRLDVREAASVADLTATVSNLMGQSSSEPVGNSPARRI